ncbi:DUF3307 domain-containing protein [Thalassotalea castellviae]|uniref:DUF3307 domain-containing protein n=1 Tax=Thalassotalea castellviae TaxID=3075612 RepID=A0ABU2ZZM7_9GAMM|nr:DUF3307 domain-containing protein [Thalassotalea sp. W431]MDT0602338.1 DUF3307 domain-containing protein [Thalassotalea sp. W431]
MELLLLLLTVHFIGDFYLQPTAWIERKSENHLKSIRLLSHILIHTILNTVVFLLTDYPLLPAIIAISFISLSHLITDLFKPHKKQNLSYFLIEQSIHLIIIILIWLYFSGFTVEQVATFTANLFSTQNMIIAISYLLACKPASVIISLALKKHTDSLIKHSENQELGLVSAGAWIGYFERCLAISFIFMGQFAGIGFLVATKTIFRFGDLTKNKDMKLTEYMMLGTLLSYAIALFIGWNAQQLYFAL